MADLYNLLNDLTENQNDEEENVVPDVNITEDTNDNTNNDGVLDPALTNDNSNNEYRDSQYDWNSSNNNDNDINLPPALREAAIQKQKQESDDRYYDDDNDIDSPTTKKTDKTDDTSMMLLSNDTLYDDTNKDLYHMMTTMQEQSSDLRYTHLRNWWIQELNSPELLQYDEELILDAIHAIETQNECIDNVSNNDTDDDEQEQNYILHTGNKNLDAMLISLIRIDLERMKFILCDLLKIRLNKIEKYPLHHILEIDMRDRMSTQEVRIIDKQKYYEYEKAKALMSFFS